MRGNDRCCASAACEIDLNHEFWRLMSIIFVIRRVAGIFYAFNRPFDQVFIFVSSALENSVHIEGLDEHAKDLISSAQSF
jgi:hypothetical protein